MQLTVMTYNTLFAGRDGIDARRAAAQIGLINEVQPDVLLMQEAKGFETQGGTWLYETERQIRMRGFLALAPHTGQNVAIFIREPLRPLTFVADSEHFHHASALLKVGLPEGQAPIVFITAHLCPHGPGVRRREAEYLTTLAPPDELVLLAGDFNSASPHDAEPQGLAELPPHHRIRYLDDDLKRADRSVLARLEAAGWIDLGHRLDTAATATVPTAAFANAEFPTMRCDYLLSSAALARAVTHYEVLRGPAAQAASDHYPVLARFEVQLGESR